MKLNEYIDNSTLKSGCKVKNNFSKRMNYDKVLTNYLKLPGSIPRGPTVSTFSTVCFRCIKFVANALIYREKRFINTALHLLTVNFS